MVMVTPVRPGIKSLFIVLVFLCSCADQGEQEIKVSNSFLVKTFVERAKKNNIKVTLGRNSNIRFKEKDTREIERLFKEVYSEFSSAFKITDLEVKDKFSHQLKEEQIQHRVVEYKSRLTSESKKFTELGFLFFVNSNDRYRAYKVLNTLSSAPIDS